MSDKILITPRRSFLRGIGSLLVAAPAIVHAANIMPIKAWTVKSFEFDLDSLYVNATEYYSFSFIDIRDALLPGLCDVRTQYKKMPTEWNRMFEV
jgi:hypothetical protein